MVKRLSKLRVQNGASIIDPDKPPEVADLLGNIDNELLDTPTSAPGASEASSGQCFFTNLNNFCLLVIAEVSLQQQDTSGQELLEGLHALLHELYSLFEGELNPVAPKAQRKVPIPDGLDLDAWINEPPPLPISQLHATSVFSPQETKSKKHRRNKKESPINSGTSEDGIFSGLMESETSTSVKLSKAELDEVSSS